ncbi:CPBP family intramembrane glutamic endopeptidase [Tengunoibacter tsumagoiensis]|uniref:CAAX prenyl protease 2/Lysostaphin resistance protein A-like domain-containing protein n=1 Tax=Tengunoibacter tsumagoiensis TaxID=2014871 RepID=A0A401ZY58_9CHLR|nr:CPBP family intramembrane glutamic endopeptidase [Tengunoibacter tsumagoiensis]GCE11794.1 hypothetical protein KTT_16530 [Tengunoibacter tsumagoiensis]
MSSSRSTHIVRTHIADSWRWMWPDILMRIIPMGLVPFLYLGVFHLPLSFLGLTLHDVPLALMVGFGVGIALTAFAALYRMFIVGPWFRRPTLQDQIFQSIFYLFLNAPVEELFFRGFLLAAVTQWTGWLGWGWLVSTAVYTLYHRLGKWSWRSVAGVGFAGIVFSLVYLLFPGPHSLLAVIIVHGMTTSGFLSWGDEVLYQRWRYRQTRIQ